MSIKDSAAKQGEKQKLQEPKQVARRQFLKEASIIVGGATIASLAFSSACGSSSDTTTSGTSVNTNTKTTTPATTTTTSNQTTSLPPAEGFIYTTPLELPPVMEIPGCTTYTATDRKYVIEHMWIKMVAENIVAIGITEKMSELTDYIEDISLPELGTTLSKGDYLLYITAAKMNVESPAPISGIVLQKNNEIFVDLVATVNTDPYVKGWLITVQLSNPEEWSELLTPQEYTDLNTKVNE